MKNILWVCLGVSCFVLVLGCSSQGSGSDKAEKQAQDTHAGGRETSSENGAHHEDEHDGADAVAAVAGANAKCPVMPEMDVDPEFFVEHKGRRIYVCCKKCKKRVAEDPGAWLAKMLGSGS